MHPLFISTPLKICYLKKTKTASVCAYFVMLQPPRMYMNFVVIVYGRIASVSRHCRRLQECSAKQIPSTQKLTYSEQRRGSAEDFLWIFYLKPVHVGLGVCQHPGQGMTGITIQRGGKTKNKGGKKRPQFELINTLLGFSACTVSRICRKREKKNVLRLW